MSLMPGGRKLWSHAYTLVNFSCLAEDLTFCSLNDNWHSFEKYVIKLEPMQEKKMTI